MGCWNIIRNYWNENWKTSNWDTTTGLNGTSWEIEEEQLLMERKKWKMFIC